MKKELKDYLCLLKCKEIIETSKIFRINKDDQCYLKEYLIPIIEKEMQDEKYKEFKAIEDIAEILNQLKEVKKD